MPRQVTLKCPYTGEPQRAVHDDTLGRRNGWYLQGGTNISLPFLSLEDASRYPVCLHTGSTLAPVRKGNLYYLPGAYDIDTRYQTEEECLYYGSMRGGKTRRKPPARPRIRVTDLEQVSDPFEDHRANKGVVESAIADKVDEVFHEPRPSIIVP